MNAWRRIHAYYQLHAYHQRGRPSSRYSTQDEFSRPMQLVMLTG
jgi:hypothetical protein